jgi:hypothetical protein
VKTGLGKSGSRNQAQEIRLAPSCGGEHPFLMFEFRLLGSPGHSWSSDVLTIGRDSSNGWVLASPGIWARHAEIQRGTDGRLTIRSLGDSVVAINGVPIRESTLRWGDAVSFGATLVRFHLAAPTQRGLYGWERTLWITLGFCLLAQAGLLVWLQR